MLSILAMWFIVKQEKSVISIISLDVCLKIWFYKEFGRLYIFMLSTTILVTHISYSVSILFQHTALLTVILECVIIFVIPVSATPSLSGLRDWNKSELFRHLTVHLHSLILYGSLVNQKEKNFPSKLHQCVSVMEATSNRRQN